MPFASQVRERLTGTGFAVGVGFSEAYQPSCCPSSCALLSMSSVSSSHVRSESVESVIVVFVFPIRTPFVLKENATIPAKGRITAAMAANTHFLRRTACACHAVAISGGWLSKKSCTAS